MGMKNFTARLKEIGKVQREMLVSILLGKVGSIFSEKKIGTPII
jgi:hypothetical protein